MGNVSGDNEGGILKIMAHDLLKEFCMAFLTASIALTAYVGIEELARIDETTYVHAMPKGEMSPGVAIIDVGPLDPSGNSTLERRKLAALLKLLEKTSIVIGVNMVLDTNKDLSADREIAELAKVNKNIVFAVCSNSCDLFSDLQRAEPALGDARFPDMYSKGRLGITGIPDKNLDGANQYTFGFAVMQALVKNKILNEDHLTDSLTWHPTYRSLSIRQILTKFGIENDIPVYDADRVLSGDVRPNASKVILIGSVSTNFAAFDVAQSFSMRHPVSSTVIDASTISTVMRGSFIQTVHPGGYFAVLVIIGTVMCPLLRRVRNTPILIFVVMPTFALSILFASGFLLANGNLQVPGTPLVITVFLVVFRIFGQRARSARAAG